MTDLSFFSNMNYHFTQEEDGVTYCCINQAGHNYDPTIANLAAHNETPNIWIAADSLAKAFYATVMADLGQKSSFNMLANLTALEYFSANLNNTIDGQNSAVMIAWHQTNPAMQSYSAVKYKTGPLSVTPSVILQQYLCQIPKLKSGGSLFVAILIADLVLLQALWAIVGLIMGWRLGKSDPQAKFCEGCAAMQAGIELREVPTTSTQYEPVLDSVMDGRGHLRVRPARHLSSETTEGLLSP